MNLSRYIWVIFFAAIGFYYLKTQEAIINPDSPYKITHSIKTFNGVKNDRLPLVIVLHPNGSKESDMEDYIKRMNIPLRVAFLRGPFKAILGFNWWDTENLGQKKQQVLTIAKDIADATLLLTTKHPTKGKPILLGYREGADIIYSIAASYPYNFSALFAIGGLLSSELYPANPFNEATTRLYAMNGVGDQKIKINEALASAQFIQKTLRNTYFLKYSGTQDFPQDFVNGYLKGHIATLK